jgi:uncharacterized membrane protein YdfJ with MMPL/SSD domain
VSRDGTSTLLLVHFRSTSEDAAAGPIDRLRKSLREPGLTLRFGGYQVAFLDVNRAVRSDLLRAELIAFPLLALLMLIIFRGAPGALIPLSTGAAALGATYACLRLLAGVLDISIFALDLALLLGLGLAVDYGLFLVSRYREEVARSGPGTRALAVTVSTAGRAVLLSGLALAGASVGLLVFPQQFIYSMGIAGVLVSLLSVAAALLIAPPLLLLGGRRVAGAGAATQPVNERSFWYRWPRWVMRRPIDCGVVGVLLLIAAAAPALRLAPTFPDNAAIPAGFESRQVADTVDREFIPNLMYPVIISLESGRPGQTHVSPALFAASLARTPGVELVSPIAPPSQGVVPLEAVLSHPPYAAASQAVVAAVRALHFPLGVGGNTAEFVDLKHSISSLAVLALVVAAVMTGAVLFLLSGSVVLAVKALVFDALGLLATLGLLVLIFQDQALGLRSVLAYHGPSAIDTTATVVLLASAFGLTTDYSILLLSRIVEAHEGGASDEDAVVTGVQRSGPLISSSALLLVIALLALASSRVFLVKQLSVGQALAIVIDVTFVRLLLVPAFMGMMGRANWWAPGWLRHVRAWLRPSPRTPARLQ